MSASITAPAATPVRQGRIARLGAALRRWYTGPQAPCDLALLSDADLAHLGISAREIRAIRRRARAVPPVDVPVDAPEGPVRLEAHPLSLLTGGALRR